MFDMPFLLIGLIIGIGFINAVPPRLILVHLGLLRPKPTTHAHIADHDISHLDVDK